MTAKITEWWLTRKICCGRAREVPWRHWQDGGEDFQVFTNLPCISQNDCNFKTFFITTVAVFRYKWSIGWNSKECWAEMERNDLGGRSFE
jgi:hypothetical protein